MNLRDELYKGYRPYFDRNADFDTNSGSYYEYLGKIREVLIEFFKEYERFQKEMYDNFDDYVDEKNKEINAIIKQIKEEVFSENIEMFEKWLDENMADIIHESMQIVWFGLNDDGYFIAVIPESWEEIQFDTNSEGQLILTY